MSKYDLEERTLAFSKKLIKTLNKLPKNLSNYKLSGQVISSGTSIGANYREANGAESKKDFRHKISLSLKESKETVYWLEILISSNSVFLKELYELLKEVKEFILIFGRIVSQCK